MDGKHQRSLTLAERLSAYAQELRFEDLSSEVVQRAKALFVDSIGCAIGGYDSEPVKIARSMASDVTSKRPATIFGSGEKTSLDLAIFANGCMVRYLDFNDGYAGKEAGHPSDNLAAIISAGEVAGADGKSLLVAAVLSYEVFCRLCDAVSIKDSGFDHVTLGAISSVVGIARILNLSPKQTAEAINLTVASNVALYQTRIGNVSIWKGCAHANASRNAAFAAECALRGITGPSPIFEGRGGYFKAISGRPFELSLASKEGHFRIMDCIIKRYPLGLFSQSVVDAALQVRTRIQNLDDVSEITIRTLQTAVNIMAGDAEKWAPTNRESADHSMPYTAGVALKYGAIRAEHFQESYLRDPELLNLVRKIKCVGSEEANAREPEAMICDFEVLLRQGQVERARVEYHRGHSRNFMSNEEVEQKFRSLADPVMRGSRVENLLDQLWTLEENKTAKDLVDLIRIE